MVGVAIDELDGVARDAGVDDAAHDRAGAARGFLGRFRDHDAACGERGSDLLDHQIDREIPRAEARNRADRMFGDHRALPERALEHAALDAFALFSEIVEQSRGRKHLAARLADRLALFERQQRRDMLDALADNPGRLVHQRARAHRGFRTPDRPAALGRGQRFVEIGCGRDRQFGDRARRGGVKNRSLVTSLAAPPGHR